MRQQTDLRPLWLAYILLVATFVAVAAGLLAWLGGLNPATAVLAGGGAFSATALLFIALQQFLR